VGQARNVFVFVFAAVGLLKQLGSPSAVDELSLGVDAGGAVGFLGANGDGHQFTGIRSGPIIHTVTLRAVNGRMLRDEREPTRDECSIRCRRAGSVDACDLPAGYSAKEGLFCGETPSLS